MAHHGRNRGLLGDLASARRGVIAAAFLALIKSRVIYRDDKIAAARRWVPILIGIMAGAFAAYLALKGLNASSISTFRPHS